MATVYKTGQLEDYHAAYRILKKVKSDDSLVSRVAPGRPIKDGNVYVIKVQHGEAALFWRADTYRWNNLGTDGCPRKDPLIYVYRWQLKSFDEASSTWIPQNFWRKEYIHAGSSSATARHKKQISIEDWGQYPYVVMEYYGTFDMDKFMDTKHLNAKTPETTAQSQLLIRLTTGASPKHTPIQNASTESIPVQLATPRKSNPNVVRNIFLHGNTETTDDAYEDSNPASALFEAHSELSIESIPSVADRSSHVRIDPRVREEMEAAILSGNTPINVYTQQVIKGAQAGQHAMVNTPTSREQVYNISRKVSKFRKQDDLFNLYDLNLHTSNFVHVLDFAKGVKVMVGLEAITNHVHNVIQKSQTTQFFYDTTFAVGDFFVSLLSIEHPFLVTKRNKSHPTITVLVLMHEFSDHTVHRAFFQLAKTLIPALNSTKAVIVMDREPGLTKAVKEVCPNMNIFYCWRHMRGNFEARMSKAVKDPNEREEVMKQLTNLMHSPNFTEYMTRKMEVQGTWPASLYTYFEKNMNEDFLTSSRWALEERGMYSQVSGITNNRAESLNAAYKKMLVNKKADFNRFSYATFFVQTRQLAEIHNGIHSFGDFFLPDEARNVAKSILIPDSDLLEASGIVDVMQIEPMVMEGKLPSRLLGPQDQVNLVRENLFLEGEARRIIANNKIEFVPRLKVYVVETLQKQIFTVKLGTKSCTCKRKKMCAHLLAVLMSNDISSENIKGTANEAYNMGDAYRSFKQKRTGKKGAPLLRIPHTKTNKGVGSNIDGSDIVEQAVAIDVPQNAVSSDSDGDMVPSDDNGGEENTEESSADEAEQSMGHISSSFCNDEPDGGWTFAKLPIVSPENVADFLITINGISLNLADIKSLDPDVSGEEVDILNTDGVQAFERGTISPGIVSAFLKMTADDKRIVAVSYFQALKFFTNGESICTQNRGGVPYKWTEVEIILIPWTFNSRGWILLTVDVRKKKLLVLDPKSFEIPTDNCKTLVNFLAKKTKTKAADWGVDLQYDANQMNSLPKEDTGVFILYCSFCVANSFEIDLKIDARKVRKRLLVDILGSCRLFNDKTVCTVCENAELVGCTQKPMHTRIQGMKLVCIKCASSVHVRCINMDGRAAKKISADYICTPKCIAPIN